MGYFDILLGFFRKLKIIKIPLNNDFRDQSDQIFSQNRDDHL
jgi:hypothetical protein